MHDFQFALIKIKRGTDIYSKLQSNLNGEGFKYFNIDNGMYEDIKRCLILVCDKVDNQDELYKLHWCECCCNQDDKGYYLKCTPLYSSSCSTVFMAVCDSIFLDINKDFGDRFITKEFSKKIFEQFTPCEKKYSTFTKIDKIYDEKSSEKSLNYLAQKNEYCKRQYNFKEPASDNRTEFQRDYDRIIYSKSFRRIVDKTQIFSASKGDHYRTRMTHTMVVCQIARSICNALLFNQSLTEAIAVSHDLGHTPFGHVGERTLHEILSKNFPNVGGFKHNYQGVRVVSMLEKDYYEIDGLDLSYQVMEGIFKHTKQKENVDLREFVNDEDLLNNLYIDKPNSVTIEGQIVAIADEIAQRSHDFDDAFAANLISIDEFLSYLKLSKFDELHEEIQKICDRKNATGNYLIPDDNELFAFQISSAIVKYFIADVVKESKIMIASYINNNLENFEVSHIIEEKLISFSENGKLICEYLEKILNDSVIGSTEVSVSDQNSSDIIKFLFDAYYNNPQLLHKGTKRKIYIDFVKDKNINNIVNIVNGSTKAVKEEFKIMKEKYKELSKSNEDFLSESDKEYLEKHKIFVRDICDYIAGMTDSYAVTEYRKIYKSI